MTKRFNVSVDDGLMGRYRSGQTGQTVNLLAHAFVGSNPALPTFYMEPRQYFERSALEEDPRSSETLELKYSLLYIHHH